MTYRTASRSKGTVDVFFAHVKGMAHEAKLFNRHKEFVAPTYMAAIAKPCSIRAMCHENIFFRFVLLSVFLPANGTSLRACPGGRRHTVKEKA